MRIQGIDDRLAYYMWKLEPAHGVEDAFDQLHETEGHGCGYTWPTFALMNALIWLWLKWHHSRDIRMIRETLEPIIERAVAANADPEAYECMREDHDSFLMQLAIMTGSLKLIGMACESVTEADTKSNEYQYVQAWTGILKYRFLDDEDKVIEQYRIMEKWKPTHVFLWPTKKLVRTFVERDYKSFGTALKSRCEQHWTWAEKEGALPETPDGKAVLEVELKNDYFLWPWVEGAFAKLAYRDGADITYDSPWLPHDLVEAIE